MHISFNYIYIYIYIYILNCVLLNNFPPFCRTWFQLLQKQLNLSKNVIYIYMALQRALQNLSTHNRPLSSLTLWNNHQPSPSSTHGKILHSSPLATPDNTPQPNGRVPLYSIYSYYIGLRATTEWQKYCSPNKCKILFYKKDNKW